MEGERIATSTGVDLLLQTDFDLKINDIKYRVEVPDESKLVFVGGLITMGLFVVHVAFQQPITIVTGFSTSDRYIGGH